MKTAQERVELALTSANSFCNLLADASRWKHKNYWRGSAYRNHPCGLVFGTIKMTNRWRTDNSCDISITDGDGWNTSDISRDSWGHGSPHPKPINGGAVCVWDCGKWADGYEAALRSKVFDLLLDVALHVERCEKEEERKRQEANDAYREKQAAIAKAALAKTLSAEAP